MLLRRMIFVLIIMYINFRFARFEMADRKYKKKFHRKGTDAKCQNVDIFL
jgi:hypothetical protein